MNIKKMIFRMSLREKIAFCTGADSWHTKAMPQYGIPSVMMSDGPHGLRCQKGKADMIGINQSQPATCFPSAVTAAATWNEELYAMEGEAIGKEGLAAGVSLILGPGCNIKRNPLGGRNFEYISEDPYLAGKMAAAFVRGQQGTGASSCLKHFAANSQEYKRQNGDSRMDMRTLREIYLTAFEIAVKEAHPDTIMCAYNKLNGIHCSDDKKLLTDILRTEWGFDGLVVTDWGAMNDRIAAFRAGCDLNMPGGSHYMEKEVLDAVNRGKLPETCVNASVGRILGLVKKAQESEIVDADWGNHHMLAQTIAEQGAVLLKNEGNLLPILSHDLILIGHMAKESRYQGSGSSHIKPTRLVNLTDAMPDVPYFACCDAYGNVTPEALAGARAVAKEHEVAVVVVGLPDMYESEAFDREHMRLPEGHDRIVEAVAAVNSHTIVVLLGGSAMEIPWEDKVKAILYMGLPGQAGGQAIANLLSGKANPSGKLTETWPLSYDDVISKETFGTRNPEYREGIFVGYRYYDKAQKSVRYPFGHGLSYTSFVYSDLTFRQRIVSVRVANTGRVKGAEVVQLYIAPPKNGLSRPERELKGFARVELEANESKVVQFTLDDRSFAVWSDGWKIPGGVYLVQVGSSSRDIRLQRHVKIDGEQMETPEWQKNSWYETLDGTPGREEWEALMGHKVPVGEEPKKGAFTMDNSCLEMKDSSWIMKLQYKITELIISRNCGGKKDLSDPAYRMMLTCATDCPLRSVIISTGGRMDDTVAGGLLLMANGHYIDGIKMIFSRVRNPFKKKKKKSKIAK